MLSLIGIFLVCMLWVSGAVSSGIKAETDQLLASASMEFNVESSFSNVDLLNHRSNTSNAYLKINKDGIKVFVYRLKGSRFGTFKAKTVIQAPMSSILSVLLDESSCTRWIDSCIESFVLKKVNFTERYHFQVMDIPFPFKNRAFIFHSRLRQNLETNSVSLIVSAVPDYCQSSQEQSCIQTINADNVMVRSSIAVIKLTPLSDGTSVTWIQHTDPSGNLPAWLVNQFSADTPYKSLKNLKQLVHEDVYRFSELIYDTNGLVINIRRPAVKGGPKKTIDYFPTF